MTHEHPWKVLFSRQAVRHGTLIGIAGSILAFLLGYLALSGGQWLLLAIAAAAGAAIILRSWRIATVRVLTSPEGVHVVNRRGTFWVPWGDIANVEVDTMRVSGELLSRMDATARDRLAARPDVIMFNPADGPRLLQAARICTHMGEKVPIDAVSRQIVLTVGMALNEHRARAHPWG